MGSFAQADAEIRELEAIVGRVGWPLARWHLLRAQATQALLDGSLGRAEELAGQFRDVAARTQDETAQGAYFVFNGDVLMLSGRYDEQLAPALSIMEQIRMPVVQAQFGRPSFCWPGIATPGRWPWTGSVHS